MSNSPDLGPLGKLYRPAIRADWDVTTLIELADWINGRSFKTSEFTPTGRPVVKIAEIKSGVQPQTKFTSLDLESKYLLKPGDLLFSWSGQPETSIGAFVWDGPEGWLNQHVFRVVPREGEVDGRFLRYLLDYLSPNFIGIAKNKQTTGLGHVTRKDLSNIEVRIPSYAEQQRIGRHLGTIDERTEVNARVMELNRQVAVAAAFGAAGRCALGDLCEVERISTSPARMAGESVNLYSIPSYDETGDPERTAPEAIKSNKLRIGQPAVLVSRLNPKFERVWLVEPDESVDCYASTEFAPLIPRTPSVSLASLWAVVCSSDFWSDMRQLVTGTSGSHQRVRWEDVLTVEIPDVRSLDEATRERLDAIKCSFVARRTELAHLGRLRAHLLRELFTGAIDFREVAA